MRLSSPLGDGVLTRIHYHTVGAGLHMPEQIDKYTGERLVVILLSLLWVCC